MSKYRLPTSVKPTLYDLYLFPDLQTGKRLFSVQLFCIRYQQHKTDINLLNNIYLQSYILGLFRGNVTVKLSLSEPVNTLVIHSNGLNITRVNVNDEEANFQLDAPYEIITITKKDESTFTTSTDSLAIEFNGDMKNRIVGLYTSSYKSKKGVT